MYSLLLIKPKSSPSHQPLVISGPSGVGKGTLIQRLINTHPNTFALTVSHTTREPRPGETDGVAYHFVSHDAFLSLISQNAFVEHAFFSGNHYGTSKKTITDQVAKGLIVVLDIEMDGVRQMRESNGSSSSVDARYVYIKPPSLESLEARLRGRGTEKEDDIQKRLAQARRELEYAEQGVHDKVIVNDDVDRAYKELEGFVFGSIL
ncbi:guanylate kinase [Aspergillus taichungensis]|uniref:Guanylate kinase n=1 Tax=Aspergillus taichungensis TaxID=482145 RepID=A0A2J5I0V5_9EURO|nr:guanylate kinase [Aspergillus taichungensis]